MVTGGLLFVAIGLWYIGDGLHKIADAIKDV